MHEAESPSHMGSVLAGHCQGRGEWPMRGYCGVGDMPGCGFGGLLPAVL